MLVAGYWIQDAGYLILDALSYTNNFYEYLALIQYPGSRI